MLHKSGKPSSQKRLVGTAHTIFFNNIVSVSIACTELEKTKKDLAALKEQAAGLTREYDRLLDEHSKAQVGGKGRGHSVTSVWGGRVHEVKVKRAGNSHKFTCGCGVRDHFTDLCHVTNFMAGGVMDGLGQVIMSKMDGRERFSCYKWMRI